MKNAPPRGAEIGATAIQIFTKQPNRWADPPLKEDDVALFRAGLGEAGITFTVAHDSYLINLATADPILRERSLDSFRSELLRARALGLDAVVTHPGNATDGDMRRGIEQNAALIQRALEEVEAPTLVLLETTAGAGSVIGSRFEELAALREHIAPPWRDRVGVCFDTCHTFSAGYDLREDYDGVFEEFDRVIGLSHLRLFHLNDSQKPFASKRDRHAGIAEGTLGAEPFRRIMNDPRFAGVPKVLETPKGDDAVAADLGNLGKLRGYVTEYEADGTLPQQVV
jgi:deoxyribonuclease-4